jgi:hypothetical protein
MADGPTLDWIRHQLDALAWQRAQGSLGEADQARYRELCQMEREWLAALGVKPPPRRVA